MSLLQTSMSKTEFTVIIIGSGGVGKTALSVQLTEGKFTEDYNPTSMFQPIQQFETLP